VLLKKPYRMNELGATVEYALQRRGCRRKLSSVVRLRLPRGSGHGNTRLSVVDSERRDAGFRRDKV
jgi:hypothetical protein